MNEFDNLPSMFTGYGFFDYRNDIIGYNGQDLLSTANIILSIISLILIVGLVIILRKIEYKKIDVIMKVLSIVIIVLHISRICLESYYDIKYGEGFNFSDNLPLYSCNLYLFTFPVAAFGKGKIKEFAMSFTAMFGILGGISNFIFFNKLILFPLWTFSSIICFIYHAIMLFVGLLVLVTKYYVVTIKSIVHSMIIVLAFSVIVLPINFILYNAGFTSVDYMQIMRFSSIWFFDDLSKWCINHNIHILFSLFVLFVIYPLIHFALYGIIKLFEKIYKKFCIKCKN